MAYEAQRPESYQSKCEAIAKWSDIYFSEQWLGKPSTPDNKRTD